MSAQNKEALQVAILGYGFGGKTFHAPLIASVPGMRLTHIVSSDPAKVKKDWPEVTVVPQPDDVFSLADIDLVVIATPNQTHFDSARRALLAGKHVVVDKPFTTTEKEALELELLAKKIGKVISVYQNRRWDGDFLTVRNLIKNGTLGEIVQFESHFDRFRPELRISWKEQPRPGSGLWYDLAPHLVDQTLQLFGLPDAVYADFAHQRHGTKMDDYFHALLRYGQMRVLLHASALIAGNTLRFVLNGRNGSFIKHGLDTQEEALIRGERPKSGTDWNRDPQSGTLTLAQGANFETQTLPNEPGNYLRYYEAVRDAIQHGAPNPVPAEEALAVMRVLDLGLRSAQEHRELPFGEAPKLPI